MRILLNEISASQTKAAVGPTDLAPTYGAWTPYIQEQYSGAWQRHASVDRDTVLRFPALFACVTLIAADIAKLSIRLKEKTQEGVTREILSPAFSPVLQRPNNFQNRIQFREHWKLSKLTWGNSYILKQRDMRGIVTALYVLDPNLVTPLSAPGAQVFYRLNADKMSSVGESITVPASEIIHDRMNAGLWHPLVGVSPITACGLASQQGLEILRTSTRFFENGARPGGILTAPGAIGDDTAKRLKEGWQENFAGKNVGKVAVLGDGLKYESLSVNPVDAQLIEQLGMSEKMVCTAYHVPSYKIGVGEPPKYDNAQVLNQIYYSDCLQKLIEDFELLMGEGLRLPMNYGVELSLDDLLKMDAETQARVEKELVGAKIKAPNEARLRFNLASKKGGDALWGQKQDHSLEALAKRDEMMTPDGALVVAPQTSSQNEPANDDDDMEAAALVTGLRKALIKS